MLSRIGDLFSSKSKTYEVVVFQCSNYSNVEVPKTLRSIRKCSDFRRTKAKYTGEPKVIEDLCRSFISTSKTKVSSKRFRDIKEVVKRHGIDAKILVRFEVV